jgi:hypothetical protein
MPLATLTETQRAAADNAASSDLKWLLSDNEVPTLVQQSLFHAGFTKMKIFAGFGESRTEVRDALRTDLGLSSTDGLEARQHVALVIAAWEAAREYITREASRRAEAQASRMPRALTPVEHIAMRNAYETLHGRLRDSETPSVHYLGRKTEDVENDEPRAEHLKSVTSREDHEEEFLSAEIGDNGQIRVNRGARDGGTPSTPEELRAKHKLIVNAWIFLRTKHENRFWLKDLQPQDFSRFSDHLLGKNCLGLRVASSHPGAQQGPKWEVILDYEFQIRKRAYDLVVRERKTIREALESACRDAELRDLYLVTPLTLGRSDAYDAHSRILSDARSRTPPPQWWGSSDNQKGKSGKSSGKGKKGKGKGKSKSKSGLQSRTPDGRLICYKFNNPNEKCPGDCTMVHVCQKCLKPGHGYTQCTQSAT